MGDASGAGCLTVMAFVFIVNLVIPFVIRWIQIGIIVRRSNPAVGNGDGEGGIIWGSSFQNQ